MLTEPHHGMNIYGVLKVAYSYTEWVKRLIVDLNVSNHHRQPDIRGRSTISILLKPSVKVK